MSTDVMRPPAETDIGRRGSELWLEREGAPENLGILAISNVLKHARETYAGETDGIPLISRTSKPGECHPSLESPF